MAIACTGEVIDLSKESAEMRKISIVRRRLESKLDVALTEAEKRARRRESLSLVENAADVPGSLIQERARSFHPGSLVFSLSNQQQNALKKAYEAIKAQNLEPTATLEERGGVFFMVFDGQTQCAKKLLSCKDLADLLGVSEKTVYRMVKSKKIKAYRVGRLLRFELKDALSFLAERMGNGSRGSRRGKRNVS
jgi:excisionase family DNA binding protein